MSVASQHAVSESVEPAQGSNGNGSGYMSETEKYNCVGFNFISWSVVVIDLIAYIQEGWA